MLDTNVLVAGLRSNAGASFQLLERVGSRGAGFEINLSVPLVLEYEIALSRDDEIDAELIDPILSYLCKVGRHREIYFLWRPFLRDPADEMVLEVAVEARADVIVTHNVRDFEDVEKSFGIRVETPREFLLRLQEEETR
ncbi:MAG: PIN domain-containing protein [Gemmatimonadota bacterium]|nr:PIN domain-containing protein [Gemmatimonadota bacterium]